MPLLVGIRDAARMLGISPHTLYAWVYQGRVQHVKLGTRTLISREELERIAARGLEKEVA